MPAAEIARRGGAVRVRTQSLPHGKFRHIYVVRDPGPRGGHTVAGETHTRKGGARSKVKADTQPTYQIKPNTGRKQRGK